MSYKRDVVERLEDYAETGGRAHGHIPVVMREAAAEIRRLREELAELKGDGGEVVVAKCVRCGHRVPLREGDRLDGRRCRKCGGNLSAVRIA